MKKKALEGIEWQIFLTRPNSDNNIALSLSIKSSCVMLSMGTWLPHLTSTFSFPDTSKGIDNLTFFLAKPLINDTQQGAGRIPRSHLSYFPIKLSLFRSAPPYILLQRPNTCEPSCESGGWLYDIIWSELLTQPLCF